jgi:hypothetical protein
VGKTSSVTRRPANSYPSGPVDSYREWVKGNDVTTLVKHKLTASAEARRLKAKKESEDERRAMMFLRRTGGDGRDEFFDDLGDSDPVYRKFRGNDSVNMDIGRDDEDL